jgi:hypothetical protein
MRPTIRPTLCCAGALALAALPVGAVAPAHAGEGEPAYSGFATVSRATPVHVELYEPTIPIPASPQAELSFGYSMVEADSSTSLGRASYLWPGDAVGEGYKTIIESLGFPPQISGPLAGDGYPFQVNAGSTGQSSSKDEPFPGMVMRARSSDDRTTAQTGYSTNCQVEDGHRQKDSGDGDDSPALPSLPGVPPPPGPSPDASSTSGQRDDGATRARAESSCRIPAQLAALVDFGGYISTSDFADTGSVVTATSRTALTDVELLGGVITVSDVHAGAVALSNGEKGTPRGRSGYGTLAIAGQEFTVGPDGVDAAGHAQKLPGLPDQPAEALKSLGVTITAPQPKARQHGDQATTDVAALVVTIDSAKLRHRLDAIPFDDLVDQVPDEAGELKKVLGAAVYLAPKFVITLGAAESGVDTVQGISIPTLPTTGAGTATGGSPGTGGGTTASVSGSPPASSAPATSPGSGTAPAADGNLQAEPTAAGLPPLYSLPGVLLLGGIALASVAGSYLRRIGVLALGGAGSCSHGLDRGLPDLRKVRP